MATQDEINEAVKMLQKELDVSAPMLAEALGLAPARRYFVTDAWVGAGGHLRRYEVTGPDGYVGLFKTYGEAMACAERMETAD